MSVGEVGRLLVFAGLMMAALGLVLVASQSVPWLKLGRLPGDIRIERDGFTFFFPLATMILASLLLSGIFWLIGRVRG